MLEDYKKRPGNIAVTGPFSKKNSERKLHHFKSVEHHDLAPCICKIMHELVFSIFVWYRPEAVLGSAVRYVASLSAKFNWVGIYVLKGKDRNPRSVRKCATKVVQR